MRISTILSLSLIGTVTATPALPKTTSRDIDAFSSAFGAVRSATATFDRAIKALTASTDINAAISDLTTKSNDIVNTLQSSTEQVNSQPALGLTESISLLSLSNELTSEVTTAIDDLIAKKSIISNAGQAAFVVTQLKAVKSAAQVFIDAVVGKVPSAVQSIANSQAGQVITVLDKGISNYSGSGGSRSEGGRSGSEEEEE